MTVQRESAEFERLVARIEEAAAPRGATVTSPDHISDATTGKTREVDVSIRFKVGTASILVIVECRKRSRPQDVQWIEQLATKRDAIKADKLIGVSERGFTESAARVAEHHRIELRTLSDVSAVDIDNWFLPPAGVTNIFREIEDVHCLVGFYAADGKPEESGFAVPDSSAPVFYSDVIESPFPAVVLVQFLEHDQAERFWQVPLDGTKTRLAFHGQCPGGWLRAATNKGEREVAWLSFSLLVSYHIRSFSLEQGAHQVYDGGKSGSIQVSSFNAPLFGGEARFEFQSSESSEPHARLKWTPKNRKDKA